MERLKSSTVFPSCVCRAFIFLKIQWIFVFMRQGGALRQLKVLIQGSTCLLHLSAGRPHAVRWLGNSCFEGVDFSYRSIAIHDHQTVAGLLHPLEVATEMIAKLTCFYFHLAKLIVFTWLSQARSHYER